MRVWSVRVVCCVVLCGGGVLWWCHVQCVGVLCVCRAPNLMFPVTAGSSSLGSTPGAGSPVCAAPTRDTMFASSLTSGTLRALIQRICRDLIKPAVVLRDDRLSPKPEQVLQRSDGRSHVAQLKNRMLSVTCAPVLVERVG